MYGFAPEMGGALYYAQGALLKVPSLAEWGAFMDGYEGSAAAAEDQKFVDIADCPDSALWESNKAGSK